MISATLLLPYELNTKRHKAKVLYFKRKEYIDRGRGGTVLVIELLKICYYQAQS